MSSRASRTIYAGNLPGDIRMREIEDLFIKVSRHSSLHFWSLSAVSILLFSVVISNFFYFFLFWVMLIYLFSQVRDLWLKLCYELTIKKLLR